MGPLFVVFEGGDSVGKSTQVRMLGEWLGGSGVAHLVTRQPGGTVIGAELRRLLLDPSYGDVSPRAEALMYAADKAQHVEESIRPALERGEVVVSDRYVLSMIAYQGAGRGLTAEEIERIGWWSVGGLRPDLTVLLDADPEKAVAAIKSKDRLEQAGLDLHHRAREFFLRQASQDPSHFLVLDATGTREAIASAVRERVTGLLGRVRSG